VIIFPIVYNMKKRILLADDEGINRLYVKSILTAQGWEVVEAANGKESLEISSRNSFDLVVVDIKMPVMDGKETARKIRELEMSRKASDDVPILGFTAYGGNELIEDLQANGIDGIIRKPITERGLLKTISAYLVDSDRLAGEEIHE